METLVEPHSTHLVSYLVASSIPSGLLEDDQMSKQKERLVELEDEVAELKAKLECAMNALKRIHQMGGPIDLTKVLEAL